MLCFWQSFREFMANIVHSWLAVCRLNCAHCHSKCILEEVIVCNSFLFYRYFVIRCFIYLRDINICINVILAMFPLVINVHPRTNIITIIILLFLLRLLLLLVIMLLLLLYCLLYVCTIIVALCCLGIKRSPYFLQPPTQRSSKFAARAINHLGH